MQQGAETICCRPGRFRSMRGAERKGALAKVQMVRASSISQRPVDVAVGARMRMTRKLRKLSQPQLGALVGVSFQQIQRYERGENSLSVPMLCKIAAALGVRPEDLLGSLETTTSSGPVALTTEAAEMLEAFLSIRSKTARKHLLGLMKALPKTPDPAEES